MARLKFKGPMVPNHKQQLAVQRRNAMLRAWKAHGLPLCLNEGQWNSDIFGRHALMLKCTACQRASLVLLDAGAISTRRLAVKEGDAIAELEGKGCTHLSAMGEYPVPDQVMAIFELELLAGGG